MPFYDYICSCGREEIAFFRLHENQIVICPVCQKAMKKDYKKMIPAYHDVPFDSVDTDITGEPIVYHTRGQLKRIAAEHGLEVNFGTRKGTQEITDEFKKSGRR